MNKFKLLLNRDIINILIGDTSFGKKLINGKEVEIIMPYLTAPNLCDLSIKFGLPQQYKFEKGALNLSRWQYMTDLIKFCIAKNNISNLLSYLFSLDNFLRKSSFLDKNEIENIYEKIVNIIIDKINGILILGNNRLRKQGNIFYIEDTNSIVNIPISNIKILDNQYISNLYDKAMIDINNRNFDSVITKTRTVLEEVFIEVIEKRNGKLDHKGNINKLFNEVKSLYNMHENQEQDKRINTLLSGLNKIVNAISDMRNNSSDAHGLGSSRININRHHALLFLNSSIVLAEFILEVEKEANKIDN